MRNERPKTHKCLCCGAGYRPAEIPIMPWCNRCALGQCSNCAGRHDEIGAERERQGRRQPGREQKGAAAEPLEKSIPTFFGLALKGWKQYKEGFLLDFGERGLLFRGIRMPDLVDRMVGQVLTDWEWLPDVAMVLYFGRIGLQFEAPVEVVEMQRKGLFQ